MAALSAHSKHDLVFKESLIELKLSASCTLVRIVLNRQCSELILDLLLRAIISLQTSKLIWPTGRVCVFSATAGALVELIGAKVTNPRLRCQLVATRHGRVLISSEQRVVLGCEVILIALQKQRGKLRLVQNRALRPLHVHKLFALELVANGAVNGLVEHLYTSHRREALCLELLILLWWPFLLVNCKIFGRFVILRNLRWFLADWCLREAAWILAAVARQWCF